MFHRRLLASLRPTRGAVACGRRQLATRTDDETVGAGMAAAAGDGDAGHERHSSSTEAGRQRGGDGGGFGFGGSGPYVAGAITGTLIILFATTGKGAAADDHASRTIHDEEMIGHDDDEEEPTWVQELLQTLVPEDPVDICALSRSWQRFKERDIACFNAHLPQSSHVDLGMESSQTRALMSVYHEDIGPAIHRYLQSDEFKAATSGMCASTRREHIDELVVAVTQHAAETYDALNNTTTNCGLRQTDLGRVMAEAFTSWHGVQQQGRDEGLGKRALQQFLSAHRDGLTGSADGCSAALDDNISARHRLAFLRDFRAAASAEKLHCLYLAMDLLPLGDGSTQSSSDLPDQPSGEDISRMRAAVATRVLVQAVKAIGSLEQVTARAVGERDRAARQRIETATYCVMQMMSVCCELAGSPADSLNVIGLRHVFDIAAKRLSSASAGPDEIQNFEEVFAGRVSGSNLPPSEVITKFAITNLSNSKQATTLYTQLLNLACPGSDQNAPSSRLASLSRAELLKVASSSAFDDWGSLPGAVAQFAEARGSKAATVHFREWADAVTSIVQLLDSTHGEALRSRPTFTAEMDGLLAAGRAIREQERQLRSPDLWERLNSVYAEQLASLQKAIDRVEGEVLVAGVRQQVDEWSTRRPVQYTNDTRRGPEDNDEEIKSAVDRFCKYLAQPRLEYPFGSCPPPHKYFFPAKIYGDSIDFVRSCLDFKPIVDCERKFGAFWRCDFVHTAPPVLTHRGFVGDLPDFEMLKGESSLHHPPSFSREARPKVEEDSASRRVVSTHLRHFTRDWHDFLASRVPNEDRYNLWSTWIPRVATQLKGPPDGADLLITLPPLSEMAEARTSADAIHTMLSRAWTCAFPHLQGSRPYGAPPSRQLDEGAEGILAKLSAKRLGDNACPSLASLPYHERNYVVETITKSMDKTLATRPSRVSEAINAATVLRRDERQQDAKPVSSGRVADLNICQFVLDAKSRVVSTHRVLSVHNVDDSTADKLLGFEGSKQGALLMGAAEWDDSNDAQVRRKQGLSEVYGMCPETNRVIDYVMACLEEHVSSAKVSA